MPTAYSNWTHGGIVLDSASSSSMCSIGDASTLVLDSNQDLRTDESRTNYVREVSARHLENLVSSAHATA